MVSDSENTPSKRFKGAVHVTAPTSSGGQSVLTSTPELPPIRVVEVSGFINDSTNITANDINLNLSDIHSNPTFNIEINENTNGSCICPNIGNLIKVTSAILGRHNSSADSGFSSTSFSGIEKPSLANNYNMYNDDPVVVLNGISHLMKEVYSGNKLICQLADLIDKSAKTINNGKILDNRTSIINNNSSLFNCSNRSATSSSDHMYAKGNDSQSDDNKSYFKVANIINHNVLPSLESLNSKVRGLELTLRGCKRLGVIGADPPVPIDPVRDKLKNAGGLDRLIIIDRPSMEVYTQIREFLFNHQHIVNGTCKVDYINLHSNRNLYIHCNSTECKSKIFTLLLGSGFKPRVPSLRYSYLRFGPVDYSTQPGIFLDSIEKIDARFKKDELIHFTKFRVNGNKAFLIFKCPKNLADDIFANPFCHFKCRKLIIKPFIPLLQCHKCSRFGHTIGFCRYTRTTCPTCGGNHLMQACHLTTPDILANKGSCANCIRNGSSSYQHSSWAKVCPIRSSYLKNLRIVNKDIDYG
jgi:hypothetical protein